MAFEITYFQERVLAEIEPWPMEVLANYARLIELLAEYGPSLRLPHSRPSVMACLSFVLVGAQALAVHFIVSWSVNASSCFTRLSRRRNKHLIAN
jgi:hypothetical protein